MKSQRAVLWAALGAWVLGVSVAGAQDAAVSDELSEKLRSAGRGEVVEAPGLPLAEDGIAVIPMVRLGADGPQFLLSDKPEYFRTGDGIALRERVSPGVVRLYVYHVPTPDAGPKTITAVIENLGDEAMALRILRYAFPEPGGDYHRIGKQGLIDYFSSGAQTVGEARRVEPGQRVAVDPAMDRATVTTDQLVHGFYEIEIDQPAEVTVLQRDPGMDSARAVDALPELPRVLPGHHPSGAGRGLFLDSDFDAVPAEAGFVYRTDAGPRQVILADGEGDPWVTGRDTISGLDAAPNKGNYGVMYRVRIPWQSPDGRGVALGVYNARSGGRWCAFQALAVTVNDGVFGAGVSPAPADAVRYGGPPELVVLQRYEPAGAGGGGVIEVLYSPPGASCLPAPLLLLPYDPAAGSPAP